MAEENTGMSRERKILVGFIVVLFLLTIGAYFLEYIILQNISCREHR